MAPTALWLFAHRALAPALHEDPRRFLATLDGAAAPRFLEQLWSWAREHGAGPDRPPLTYDLQRIANGAIVRFRFRDVTATGEPHAIRVAVKDGAPAAPPAYARVFLLEHSEYATEQAGRPTAILCEAAPAGLHRNHGVLLDPGDDDGLDAAVFAILRRDAAPAPPA